MRQPCAPPTGDNCWLAKARGLAPPQMQGSGCPFPARLGTFSGDGKRISLLLAGQTTQMPNRGGRMNHRGWRTLTLAFLLLGAACTERTENGSEPFSDGEWPAYGQSPG